MLVGLGSIYVFEFFAALLGRLADASMETATNPIPLLGKPFINWMALMFSERFSTKHEEVKACFLTCIGFAACSAMLLLLYGNISDSETLPKHFEYVATVVAVVGILSFGTRYRTQR